jgi:SAM-dependent methyltransferase
MPSAAGTPSPLFDARFEDLRAAARLGPIADLACGRGRHAQAAALGGLPVVALDRRLEWLRELRSSAAIRGAPVATVQADFERDGAIPLAPGRCGAVLVFRYLHRPLADAIARLLAPGGLLLYETFLEGQRDLGYGPRRDAFLLKDGELPGLFPDLEVLSFDEGVRELERPEATARLAARRPL